MTPTVAIVGRQNVGKSTLVNRLVGARTAIAHDRPGVTRDRLEVEATWRGRTVRVVDTAGFVADPDGIEVPALEQAAIATAEADVVVLVVDVRAGITEEDATLAARLRRSPVPVIVAANKADADADLADVARLHALGLGEPIPVSALHGRGSGDLLDRIVDELPPVDEVEDGDGAEPRFVIVGRPNVGKSSLFNQLLGVERALVSDEPGTTRDAVDSVVEWPGYGRARFLDTAGMRRGGKVRGVEYYGFVRAAEAIGRAHVALLVLDATEGFTGEDKRIAARVFDEGRALLVVANKWDLVEERDRTFADLTEALAPFGSTSVVRTSAVDGRGIHRLPPILIDLHGRWARRFPTASVTTVVRAAQDERPTKRGVGTLRYATQVRAGPPTIVVFGGGGQPEPSYRRYLENRLRREFDWQGVPIRLRFRGRAR